MPSKPNTHFIITNREITIRPKNKSNYVKVNQNEYLRTDGRELATENLRFGTVSFKTKRSTPQVEIFEESDYEELSMEMKNSSLPSHTFFRELYTSMKGEEIYCGEVLFFIHGYKSDLDISLETVKKLHYRYVENEDSPIKKIVLFTWPAMGKVLKYRNDARDAKASGYALVRAMRKYSAFLEEYITKQQDCKQRIHLMAHSMGNRVLHAMMEDLSNDEEQNLNNLFSEAILVGADVAYDVMEKPSPMYDLIDICERIHILYHRKDRALGISETTKNAFNRLGRWGVKNSRNIPDDVFQYDITHVKDDLEKNIFDKAINHWSYYTSSEAVDLIVDILTDYQDDF